MFGIASPARKCHKTELGARFLEYHLARGTSIYKVGFFYSFAFLHLYVFVWVALRKAHSRPYTQLGLKEVGSPTDLFQIGRLTASLSTRRKACGKTG